MKAGPSDAVLANGAGWGCLLSSYRGDEQLADDIPVASGVLTIDSTQQVPERLTFAVPDADRGFSWVPDGPDHPLASNGQRLDVQIVVDAPVSGQDWQIRQCQLLIVDYSHDDVERVVNVEALGLLQVVADNQFTEPEVPRTGDTFTSALTRLIGDCGLGVEFDDALVDRALPQSFQWDSDRLGAVYDIADAWPARVRVDSTGTVQILAPLPDTPDVVATLKDGEGGTIISAPRSGTRDGVYNVMVGRSSATDDSARSPLQVVVQVQGGPLDPDTYGPKVGTYTSTTATTVQQLTDATTVALRRSVTPALSKTVTLPADPRFEIDDGVELVEGNSEVDDELTVTLGWVIGLELPLTYDGESQLTIGTQVYT